MKKVKITYEELQKWKAARYDNQVIKNILAKHLNVKSSEIDDYDQINYGLTFYVWLDERMKYQEALLELGKYTVVLSWSKNQTCSINELNEFKLLQELVDKATPKEPDKIIDDFCDDTSEYYFCPNCEKEVKCENEVDDTPYCPFCGQALKWKN